MGDIVLIGGEDALSRVLAAALAEGPGAPGVRTLGGPPAEVAAELAAAAGAAGEAPAVVYVAAGRGTGGGEPAPADAEACLGAAAAAGAPRAVVVASAAIHPPSHHHLGRVAEEPLAPRVDPASPAARWRTLEEAAGRAFAGRPTALTLLRPTAVPVTGGADLWSRLFARRWAPKVPGFDPTLQVLDPRDLAAAVGRALAASPGGVYHVAPAGAVPLRAALRLAGCRPLPLPRWLLRQLFPEVRRGWLAYLVWSWTVSGEKIRRELGFEPRRSSAEAVAALGTARGTAGARRSPGATATAAAPPEPERQGAGAAGGATAPAPEPERRGGREEDRPLQAPARDFDDYGLDPRYAALLGRTWFRFLHDLYWRIEVAGVEHVPARGRAVLVGMHRGFMPFDGVMAFHHLAKARGRYPRFLLHPCLLKFPFLFDHMTKLGGVPACQESADWVLGREGLLGIFPEGIRGAFTFYREAYRLGNFGRHDFVRLALRNRAPLVPFVTVGSAEIFPIVGRLDWRWVKRWTEWPFLPVTLSLPMVPLPSKWHTRYLPALHVEADYPPEAAEDPEAVAAISAEVRRRMQEAIDDLLARRRSIFFGSVFAGEERSGS
jgi:1-acyl-sn-glycerol-3-phosphate acyltransferase/nucleoside-diphosphate-sugar epimerase